MPVGSEVDTSLIGSRLPDPDGPDSTTLGHPARWHQRLREAHRRLLEGGPSRGRALGELWLVLNVLIGNMLPRYAQRYGAIPAADIEDIASEKSLDLLRKIDSGAWDPCGLTDQDIVGFLSSVARNGAIDHLRRRRRHREIEVDLERNRKAAEGRSSYGLESPDAGLERRRFVAALRECAEQLKPRSRRIWFFRVFYGLSSQEIALNPDVALKPRGVDMLLSRTRRKIGACMESKGHRATELPAGTFVEIWDLLQTDQEV